MINSSQLNTPSQINSLLLVMETELMATASMFIYVSFYWIDAPSATQKASIRTSVRTSMSAILARQIVIPRIKRVWTQSGHSDAWTFSSASAPVTVRTASDIKHELTSALVCFSLGRALLFSFFPLSSFYFVCSLFIFLFFCLFFSHKQINDSILLDINECSEGTDDCNRKTQLCLNTRGSYKCQEKIGDKCLLGLKYNSETKLCEGGYCLIYSQALSSAKLTFSFCTNQRINQFNFELNFLFLLQLDINECQLDPDSCDDGYKCINTIGSFECIQLNKKPKYE